MRIFSLVACIELCKRLVTILHIVLLSLSRATFFLFFASTDAIFCRFVARKRDNSNARPFLCSVVEIACEEGLRWGRGGTYESRIRRVLGDGFARVYFCLMLGRCGCLVGGRGNGCKR